MSVASGDLVVYGSANMQLTDTGTQGGSIDTTTRIIFTSAALANAPGGSTSTLSVLSDEVGDNGWSVIVTGRNVAGSIISESIPLSGTTEVDGLTTFERILVIDAGRTVHGNITIQDSNNDDIAVIETGVRRVRRPFYNVSADVAGGSARTYYEKVFIKNNNATNALLSAQVIETADPQSVVAFDLDANVDGSTTSTNRITAPAASGMQGSPTFDSTAKALDNDTDLGAGEAIGVWLQLSLAAGTAATKTTYTLAASGSTT